MHEAGYHQMDSNNLSNAQNLIRIGETDKAFKNLEKLQRSEERDFLLAICLIRLKRFEESSAFLTELRKNHRDNADLTLKLGVSLHGQDKIYTAQDLYKQSIRNAKSNATLSDAVMQYCLASLELGLPEHVLDIMKKYNFLCQTEARFRYVRGITHLTNKNYKNGWTDYESRFEAGCSTIPNLPMPRWDGIDKDCSQKRLLVVCEQGLGDSLHFLGFVKLLIPIFKNIGVLAPPPLLKLFKELSIFDDVHDMRGLTDLADYHYFIPILSIPLALDLSSFERFKAPFEVSTKFNKNKKNSNAARSRVNSVHKKPRIALNWQGNVDAESPITTHRSRSFKVNSLESIQSLCNADLACVQHGPAALDILNSRLCINLESQPCQDMDFVDTANILTNCDFLITCDTSIAHLGGLLGVTTLVALKKHPSWQWGTSNTKSIWYSSMECFRQEQISSWESAMKKIDNRLKLHKQDEEVV
ncbi:MAG: hypothetical protein FJY58_10490 [Betaproteobacteria bacterium]|nr:hypothetical protein [Betaproteobacteria bacterium]